MIERINCSDTAMMTKPSEHGAMTKPMDAAARISGMSTSAAPASASSAFVVDVNMIAPWISVRPMGPRYCACARSVHVKMFADQLFALLPKRLGALRIEGVRPHTAAEARHGNHLGDVAVFAIAAGDRLSIADTGAPHGSADLKDRLSHIDGPRKTVSQKANLAAAARRCGSPEQTVRGVRYRIESKTKRPW